MQPYKPARPVRNRGLVLAVLVLAVILNIVAIALYINHQRSTPSPNIVKPAIVAPTENANPVGSPIAVTPTTAADQPIANNVVPSVNHPPIAIPATPTPAPDNTATVVTPPVLVEPAITTTPNLPVDNLDSTNPHADTLERAEAEADARNDGLRQAINQVKKVNNDKISHSRPNINPQDLSITPYEPIIDNFSDGN